MSTQVRYLHPLHGWRDGILWNHNTGVFPSNHAEVKDTETGELVYTTEWRLA